MKSPIQRQLEIFSAALDRPAGPERDAFVAQACGEDGALRGAVETLLAHHAASGPFLVQPAGPVGPTGTVIVPINEKAGDRIGRYRLLQKIGEGGCGVVYMAEQEEPVRRRVALKVIKLGMDTREVIARFEAERQALAMMDHPNIAKVLDAGATDTGRPFFVMELVKGIPATRYANENRLGIPARLALFIKICQAVQHAHQKGIIHRDLKPSNVLVADHDGVPVPKVIDFGIAKATTDQRLTDKTLFTALEQFIGTPAYMSPEQAKLSGLDVDTRSDIYSLGVLLYELLTGRTPFDVRRLMEAGFDEIRRIIREEDPPRPSTRLSTLDAAEQTDVAAHRQSEPIKLMGVIRGDLDWIVMKCLEKDRTRRYETANGLAADLQRHLDSEPVLARPPSALYRFQKMARRNKLAFAAASAVFAVLVLGIAISAWQAIRATRAEHARTIEQRRAEAAANQATRESVAARSAQQLADQRLYESLVRQASALRTARRVGYRRQVFNLLQQAYALDVPNRDLADLRREAASCLGDFVGLEPVVISNGQSSSRFQLTTMDLSGRVAALAMSDGSILVRHLPAGDEAGRLKGPRGIVNMSFNSTGDRLISLHMLEQSLSESSPPSIIIIWSCGPDGVWRESEKLPVPGAFRCLSVARGDLLVLLDRRANALTIQDFATRNEVFRVNLPNKRIWLRDVAVSPDGRLLAVQTVQAAEPISMSIEVWDLQIGTRVGEWEPGVGEFGPISFSPDSKHLGCLSQAGAVIAATDDLRRVSELKDYFSPDSRLSFFPGQPVVGLPLDQQDRVRLWDYSRNEDIAVMDEPQSPYAVVFSANARILMTSGREYARLYSLDVSAERLALNGHIGGVPSVDFSPDGSRIASIGKDRTLKVWDAKTGRVIWESVSLSAPGQSVAHSPDGRCLVTTDYLTQRLLLWDALSGKRLMELGTNAPLTTWSARFSPDGRFLAAAGDLSRTNGEVRLWSLDWTERTNESSGLKASLVSRYTGPACWSLAFAPDSQQLAFMDRMSLGTLYVWDFASDNRPKRVKGDMKVGAQCVSYLPGGREILAVGLNREVQVIDAATGRLVHSFPTTAERGTFCVSPDGTKLAITTADRHGVELWNPGSGRLLYALPEHTGAIWAYTWSPDSQRLAVSRSNGDIAIWNLNEVERVFIQLGLQP